MEESFLKSFFFVKICQAMSQESIIPSNLIGFQFGSSLIHCQLLLANQISGGGDL